MIAIDGISYPTRVCGNPGTDSALVCFCCCLQALRRQHLVTPLRRPASCIRWPSRALWGRSMTAGSCDSLSSA